MSFLGKELTIPVAGASCGQTLASARRSTLSTGGGRVDVAESERGWSRFVCRRERGSLVHVNNVLIPPFQGILEIFLKVLQNTIITNTPVAS